MARSAAIWMVVALLAPLSAAATTLDYDAYVGKTKVGGAEIVIERATDSYLIRGKAWAEGLFQWLTEWRSRFTAAGRLEGDVPVAEGYSLIEQAKHKMKEISLANGEMKYVKNGTARTAEPPASKLDLLSALFMPRGCDTNADVHNGKDRFFVTLKRAETMPASSGAHLRCEFEVRDQDDEKINAIVWLGVVEGLTVPVRLDLSGALAGTLKLRA